MFFYDAHCHLQDARLRPAWPQICADLRAAQVRHLVVNGTREADWGSVETLAKENSSLLPSFGLHPWYIKERSQDWLANLRRNLEGTCSGVGEIGLDRWIDGYDSEAQEQVFAQQLALAASLQRPISIHCLRAWGRLFEILSEAARPSAGFLLHSYAGPVEMIPQFVQLGGYFSFSGYFAHPRKSKQRETFRHVPKDRLLIETDAPDMIPPERMVEFRVAGDDPAPNHPGNVRAVYRFLSEFLELPLDQLASAVEANFRRLFRAIL